ncbi:MAG: hypothetical protein ACMG57_05180 [Candidatus Dojkabacteria bacterium]
MKIVLSVIFLLIAGVLGYLSYTSYMSYVDSKTNTYTYVSSEKSQIITIEAKSFQFVKDLTTNNYKIISKDLNQIELDGSKYQLSTFFSDWEKQALDSNSTTLFPTNNCKYINFIYQINKGKAFSDNLQYLYCTNTATPNLLAI